MFAWEVRTSIQNWLMGEEFRGGGVEDVVAEAVEWALSRFFGSYAEYGVTEVVVYLDAEPVPSFKGLSARFKARVKYWFDAKEGYHEDAVTLRGEVIFDRPFEKFEEFVWENYGIKCSESPTDPHGCDCDLEREGGTVFLVIHCGPREYGHYKPCFTRAGKLAFCSGGEIFAELEVPVVVRFR